MTKNLFCVIAVWILVSSCATDETQAPQLSTYNLSVISYFKEIALGFEFGSASEVTRRWESDMKIFVGGNPSQELLSELDLIISEINELSTTSFAIETVPDTLQSNFYLYFGSGDAYAAIFPWATDLVKSNYGLFSVFFNASNQIYGGIMYVDLFRAATSVEQKHLLREELTQSLGLAKDSYLYPESIFQQSYATKTTQYAEIDEDLIRLLYHPEMEVGLDANQVGVVLKDILLAEQ